MHSIERFSTGAQRDSEGDKPRLDMLPPYFRRRMGELLKKGAAHYGENNWLKGMKASRALHSLHRHLGALEEGQTDEDHAAAIMFNTACIMWAEYLDSCGHLSEKLYDLPTFPLPKPSPSASAPTGPKTHFADRVIPMRFYVAGPFSAETQEERDFNVLHASEIGLNLMRKGHMAHVPHSATERWHGKLEYEDFMRLDLSLIEHWATALFFIGPSPGANRERALAEKLGLPIYERTCDVPEVGSLLE